MKITLFGGPADGEKMDVDWPVDLVYVPVCPPVHVRSPQEAPLQVPITRAVYLVVGHVIAFYQRTE